MLNILSEQSGVTITSFLSQMTEIVEFMISLLGKLVTVIMTNPLLLFGFGISIAFMVVGLFKRLA